MGKSPLNDCRGCLKVKQQTIFGVAKNAANFVQGSALPNYDFQNLKYKNGLNALDAKYAVDIISMNNIDIGSKTF